MSFVPLGDNTHKNGISPRNLGQYALLPGKNKHIYNIIGISFARRPQFRAWARQTNRPPDDSFQE